MTYTQHLAQWVASNRSALERFGQLSHQRSTDGRDNPSAQIALERADGSFVELLVWDSGEAEFGYGERPPGVDEHHDLAETQELDELLRLFMARATG